MAELQMAEGRNVMHLKDKNILVTGGTGSFGRKLIKILLSEHEPRRVVAYSRDELKQFDMKNESFFAKDDRLRFFIGDVRDRQRMARAFDGVDVVVHAAALKQVVAAEYNPFEAIKTNIHGAQNVIDCAIDKGVSRVIALSTDKAANPVNLYGATKLCSDKLFVAGNAYAGAKDTAFSVVRYGNVAGSRGSVVPFFLKMRKTGVLPLTDERMTRFWIKLEYAVRFVIDCLGRAKGGELFVPKIPSVRVRDIAEVIAPEAKLEIVGVRPGEKLHEVMVTEDDGRNTVRLNDRYIIFPPLRLARHDFWWEQGTSLEEGFRYSSDANNEWIDKDALKKIIAGLELPEAEEWAEEQGVCPRS